MFLGESFMAALDANKDGSLSREEFKSGFQKWFDAWNSDQSGALTEQQLRAGLDRDLSLFGGGPPGQRRFGPPD